MKKYNYKFIIALLTLSLIFILSGCKFNEIDIYDNESKIVAQGDTYSFYHRSMQKNLDEVTMEFIKFYGTMTLWTLDAANDATIDIIYNFEIENGRFKIVLINSDNEIFDVKEGTSSGSYSLNISEGKTRIKLVGYEAKGELTYSIQVPNEVNVSSQD